VERSATAPSSTRGERSEQLTAINVPDAIDESIRDLCRGRSDAVDELTRAKQRLKSFLLRLGYHYTGKANWSEPHKRYLRSLKLPLPAHQATLEEYLLAFEQATARVARCDDLLTAHVPQWLHYPAVQALMAFRGAKLVAATVLVAEIGDIRRFRHPRHLMAFLGLVPHEQTTGDTRRLGAITKAGNVHARWMLIEMVQSALLPPKVSPQLTQRQEGQPPDRRELSWKTQCRLHKRGWHLLQRGVMKPKVTVALARDGARSAEMAWRSAAKQPRAKRGVRRSRTNGGLCLGHAPPRPRADSRRYESLIAPHAPSPAPGGRGEPSQDSHRIQPAFTRPLFVL
jgi:transposase